MAIEKSTNWQLFLMGREIWRKGNENRENLVIWLPFHGRSGRKGSENRETQRNPLPLPLARSSKGNENRENLVIWLLFHGRSGQKGSENRGSRPNWLPFRRQTS
ncbi:MAG: hypothetical protein J6B84_01920 [Eubacterium sp.]|nr:hypothetical protein [Eubacterium sp.]